MDYLVRIENDLYDISDRAREIDPDYYIVYNTAKKRYEAHNSRCRPSICLVIGKVLDARTLTKLRETHISRLNAIIEGIEKANHCLEKSKESSLRDEATYKTDRLCRYLYNGGSKLPSYEEI